MNYTKLKTVLLIAGITLACTAIHAAEGDAPGAPKAAPKTLPPASSKTGLTFDKDVKPLFEASCIKCHGAQKPKGALNLTTRETTLEGGEEGKVIEVGNSAKSSLVVAIARINPKTAMPPTPKPRRTPPGQTAPAGEKQPEKVAGSGGAHDAAPIQAEKQNPPGGPGGRNQGPPPKPLTAEEVGIVRAWIDQGAK